MTCSTCFHAGHRTFRAGTRSVFVCHRSCQSGPVEPPWLRKTKSPKIVSHRVLRRDPNVLVGVLGPDSPIGYRLVSVMTSASRKHDTVISVCPSPSRDAITSGPPPPSRRISGHREVKGRSKRCGRCSLQAPTYVPCTATIRLYLTNNEN